MDASRGVVINVCTANQCIQGHIPDIVETRRRNPNLLDVN